MALSLVILAQDVSYRCTDTDEAEVIQRLNRTLSKMTLVTLLGAWRPSTGPCLWQSSLPHIKGTFLIQEGRHIHATSGQGTCQGPLQKSLWHKGEGYHHLWKV